MKALTLTQPWATLVAIGAKRIETRSWSTKYRGPLAIHAAKGFPKWAREFTMKPVCYQAVKGHGIGSPDGYPTGVVLATCDLVDCLPTEATCCIPGVFDDFPELNTPLEREFGDYSAGRYGWVLENVRQLQVPVPAKGSLGLWEWGGGALSERGDK
jgi:hypothetical protein